VAAALHRVCTDDVLRRTLADNGRRRAAELQGERVGRQFVEAIAGVVGRP
jgi:hypothetical protein